MSAPNLALTFLLFLVACDSSPVPVVVEDATSARGTFVGTVNGAEWTAPVVYTIDDGRSLTRLKARTVSPPPDYYTWSLSFRYGPGGLAEGGVFPSYEARNEETGRRHGALLTESYGDAVVNYWHPVELGPGAFQVTEVDSAAGRLRATFAGALVARFPAADRADTKLPDTVRVEGAFEVDLFDTIEDEG